MMTQRQTATSTTADRAAPPAPTQLFIDGKLVDASSGSVYPNIDPATEGILGMVADAGCKDMEAAISAARRSFDHSDWATNHPLRLHCLQQLQTALIAAQDHLRPLISAVGPRRALRSCCYASASLS